ncbi:MAG: DUF2254 domain-containing protein [Pseudomonadota bacterium]
MSDDTPIIERLGLGGTSAMAIWRHAKRAYYSIKASFWLIPSLIALTAIFVAPFVLQADFTFGTEALVDYLPLPQVTEAGARDILSTVAGSMMTIASLVFSMTLVALSLISQQLGSRVLLIFMEDRTLKVVLGFFIATFIFAVMVLGTVGVGEKGTFIPRIGVYATALLALVSFGLMIYFIHHISTRIQADVIIADLGKKFVHAARRVAARPDEFRFIDERAYDKLYERVQRDGVSIELETSGYLHSTNVDRLVTLAAEHDLLVTMELRPGMFALAGLPVLTASGERPVSQEVREQLAAAVHVGERRTREEHVEFEINALVEMALRALSPGINDPYTARTCIDNLTEGLASFLTDGPDHAVRLDENGMPRVLMFPETFDHFLNTAFHPIRRAGDTTLMIVNHLLDALIKLASLHRTPQQAAALQQVAEDLDASALSYFNRPSDVAQIDERQAELARLLKRQARLREAA